MLLMEAIMSVELQELMRQIEGLSPDKLKDLRQRIEAMTAETPEQALSRKLREVGLVHTPRLARDSGRPTSMVAVVVDGEPLSQTLIRERR